MQPSSDHEHIDSELFNVQANLDDMNSEFYPFLLESLFQLGVNDAYLIPIIMKKGRPGIMINVLVSSPLLKSVESLLFQETTTLGLRYTQTTCHRLARTIEEVKTPWGDIRVKKGFYQGKCVQISPENKDCVQAARKHNVPLQEVYQKVRELV